MHYRLTTGKYGRFEGAENRIYRAGDVVDLSDGEAERLAGQIEPDDSPHDDWPESLSPRALSALRASEHEPADVPNLTDEELLSVKGVGPAALEILREELG